MPITPEQLAANGSEHSQQAALFCWAASSGIPELKWLFAIPNGFFASPAQKAKMKAEGLRSGVWDIYLPVPIIFPGYEYNEIKCCGLWLEMKHEKYRYVKNGGLTDKQLEFKNDLQDRYKFAICYSWIEAKNKILEYLCL